MFFSIIIPAYNAENTITQTLDSVLNIPSEIAEIIIIDDGSIDTTWSIIQSYTLRFPHIKAIRQPNKGVSVARNVGIEKARGKYLWFVDADDTIDTAKTKDLLDKIHHEDYDFIWFRNVNVVNGNIEKAHNMPENISDGKVTIEKWRKLYKAGMLWQYWLKRELIIKYNIWFMTWAKWFEDSHFLLLFTSKAMNAYISNNILYHYMFNPKGAMRNSSLRERHICSVNLSIDLLNREGYDKKSLKFIKEKTAISIAWCIREADDTNSLSLYNLCKKNKVFPLALSGGSIKQKLQILLLNLNYPLYRLFCKII